MMYQLLISLDAFSFSVRGVVYGSRKEIVFDTVSSNHAKLFFQNKANIDHISIEDQEA